MECGQCIAWTPRCPTSSIFSNSFGESACSQLSFDEKERGRNVLYVPRSIYPLDSTCFLLFYIRFPVFDVYNCISYVSGLFFFFSLADSFDRIVDVLYGQETEVFQRHRNSVKENCSFSVVLMDQNKRESEYGFLGSVITVFLSLFLCTLYDL